MFKGFCVFLICVVILCGCDSGAKTAPASDSVAITKEPSVPKQETNKPKASYSVLTIDSVKQSGTAADIQGSTDLPDDSVITVSIELYVKDPNATYVGNESKAEVKNGKWHTKIDFPKVADFAKGPHDATVLFTPRAQTEEVLALIGKNGEKLQGKSAHKTIDFRVMEVTKRVKLSVTKSISSMPNPDKYPSSDPSHCLAVLLGQWKDHNWTALAKDATLPEQSSVEDRKKEADNWLGFRDLESAEITNVDTEGQISRMTVKVKYAVGSELKEDTMGFVALKMGSNNRPSASGKWRVNLQGIRNSGF